MSWDAFDGDGVTHAHSDVETQRFGVSMGRVVVGREAPADLAAAELSRLLAAADDDVLMVRWPAEQLHLAAVCAASGRRVIAADSLVYWEADPARLADFPAAPGLVVSPLDADDEAREVVGSVVADSFAQYGNHYRANPLLSQAAALAGYVEWAERSLEADGALVLREAGAPVAVATVAVGGGGRDLEILLAGVVAHAQGRSLYRHLLAGVGARATQAGCERVIISTQVQNTRVQRAWARAGFEPFGAVTTVHAVSGAGWPG